MKTGKLTVCAILLATGLPGCQNNFVVVGARPNNNAAIAAVASACRLSDQEKASYNIVLGPKSISQPTNIFPDKAKSNKVDGCAGVRLRVDANGNPVDVTVTKEYPPNYGLGDTEMRVVQATKFEQPKDPTQWYYTSTAWTFAK